MTPHVFLLTISLASATAIAAERNHECVIDKKALMALDEQHFDQDISGGGGGWRALASKPECEITAADIIRDYRTTHHSESRLLFWHEGQLRAAHGDYKSSIPLLEKSRKSPQEDVAGWNPYVDATVAFLRKDHAALEDARARLAVVKPGGDMVVKDGFIEGRMADGSVRKMPWPINLDVVDALLKCFDKPYSVAYGSDECR